MDAKDFELYQSKLDNCDKEFFDGYTINDEDVFFQEVHDILIQENYAPEEFAESLITYYHEHGDFGNAVNHRIAKWLIYQDNEYYEYWRLVFSDTGCGNSNFYIYCYGR
jgi:hypothetical protein